MSFWCAGYRHVTASYGTEGFTADHLDALVTNHTARVLIAYDRDPAGDRAAEALGEKLMAEGIECFRIVFPRGADANTYACGAASATEALGRVIRAAQWMGAGGGTESSTHLHWASAPAQVSSQMQAPAGPAGEERAAKERNGSHGPDVEVPSYLWGARCQELRPASSFSCLPLPLNRDGSDRVGDARSDGVTGRWPRRYMRSGHGPRLVMA